MKFPSAYSTTAFECDSNILNFKRTCAWIVVRKAVRKVVLMCRYCCVRAQEAIAEDSARIESRGAFA